MNLVASGEKWINRVASNWSQSRIRNVVTLSPGYSTQAPENEELCTVVPMENLSEYGRIDLSNQLECQNVQPGLTLFEEGDVIFAKITPCMENGKGAFVDHLPTKYGFGSTEFHVLRPNAKVNGKFLYYYTFNPIFRAYAAENMTGAAGQKRVTSRFLKDTRLFLPSIAEQERIVAFLDASCAAINAAVAAKRQQIENLKNLKHSKIYGAVTRGFYGGEKFKESGLDWIREIPSHWSIRRIKDIAELKSGDAIQAEDIVPEGDYPVYGGNGLRGYTSSYTHDGHFVLIGRQGALCGNINYANGRFWATEHAVVVTTVRQCDILWLGELLRVMNLNQYSNAAAQPGLAVDRIKFLKMPIPPTEEQNDIARGLKEIILSNERISDQIEQQIATLVAYRKSLIHECVTGQRRIKEEDVARVHKMGKV